MLAIIAALPREIAGLVKGLRADVSLLARGIHLYRLPAALVVAGGMGAQRATAAVAAALEVEGVDTLLSAGLAGSCTPALSPGHIAEANLVIDVHTGERFRTDAGKAHEQLVLVTSSTIASVREKTRLAESYSAAMVDMEAATVARLASAHGLAFRALKGVSDAHDFELASLARFEGRHGTFRTGRFAVHTAVRPHHWARTVKLGRHSAQALACLNARLAEILASGT